MKIFNKILFAGLITVFLAGCAGQGPYMKLDPALQTSVATIDGYKYLPLKKVCDVYGLKCDWDTYTKIATLRYGPDSIILRAGGRVALVNGRERELDAPVMMKDLTVFVPLSFTRSIIAPIASAASFPAPAAPVAEAPKKFTVKTVALDTGHGGKDPGAIGRARGIKEKDLTLAISKRIKEKLENAGLKVVMTRDSDKFITLQKRCDIANASPADIFVSIHINASLSRYARGFECYYLSTATDDNARAIEAFEDSSLRLGDDADVEHSSRLDKTLWDMMLTENRKESAELAGLICRSVDESQLIRNNGVKTARFYVLKHTHIPAVLVENGYISNRLEEMKFKDPAFLDRLSDAVVRGILRYKKRYEDTEGFTDV